MGDSLTPADSDHGSPATTWLSAAHARALSSHFKTVEEYLRVVASWMDGFEGIFYGAPAELREEQRARARALIGDVLSGLERVRGELGLDQQRMSSIGVMRAYLSELWVSLVETRSRYLRGYGEVPSELAEYLDRHVGELEAGVNEIRRLVETAGKPESGGSVSGSTPGASEIQSTSIVEGAKPTRVTDGS
ncbi:MAG TPA: hypothetical protein VMT20_05410 [Terriglobia bacterium]|nr:hypothetical protein [Terriglobia bacterium]